MDEETLRKMALEQYLQGKTPVSIYSEMGRTRPWFFKWLHRYRSGDPGWYKDKPQTPHGRPRETHPEMKKLVKNIRIDLEEHPWAQIGTSAIKREFKKLGVTPPSDRTINRILKREGLVKKTPYTLKGVEYSYFTRPWDSTTSIRRISWAQDTSKTMAASLHSTSWIYSVIASSSTPSEEKTTELWL